MASLLTNDNELILGTGYRVGAQNAQRELVRLPVRAMHHFHCSGISGYGKSTWVAALIVMLLARNVGVFLIDPAGDLARLVLRLLWKLGYFQHDDAFTRLLYLDIAGAARQNRYLPFNILNTSFDPHTTSGLVLEAFKRAWPALQAGTAINVETFVRLSSHVLSTCRLPLLPAMYTLLTNPAFRETLLQRVPDAYVRSFFTQFTSAANATTLSSTLKRLFLLTFPPVLRYSLGQRDNVLNFRSLLDNHQSVIMNLNLPDPDAMRFLGCLATVSCELGAKSRGDIPAEERNGVHILILDEFQNFISRSEDALSHMLEECRKYGLFTGLIHQHWAQVPPDLRGALRNCNIEVTFKLERPDAQISYPLLNFPYHPYLRKPTQRSPFQMYAQPRYYSREEQKQYYLDSITHLASQEAFIKLPGGRLYQMRSLTVIDPHTTDEVAIIEREYLHRYFRPVSAVEADISHLSSPFGNRHLFNDTMAVNGHIDPAVSSTDPPDDDGDLLDEDR